MSVLKIYTKGDECLSKRCHEVTRFDRRLKLLIRDMKDTLRDANGAGLAAPQVGILRRVFVINMGEEIKEFINPEITEKSGEQTPVEGCLSIPGVWGRVKRPAYVKVRAYDCDGNMFEAEGEGVVAEAFDHENDHLDGKLFDSLIYEYVDMEDQQDEAE